MHGATRTCAGLKDTKMEKQHEPVEHLVQADRVHRRVYTDPDIFALEMTHLWGYAWVYIGHESQVPEAGSYLTTTLGTRPVIMVRGDDDQIRVLHNRCAHKGAKVATRPCGKASVLRCPYHGWSYGLDGALKATPHAVGFEGTGFSPDKFGLAPVANTGSYEGFVFAQLNDSGVTLENFLGDTRYTIDNVLDRSPAGRVSVAGPGLPYLHDCNWKMFVENLNDAVHPMVAHGSVGAACRQYMSVHQPETPPNEAQIIFPFASSYEFFDGMGVTALPYGHSYMGGNVSIHSEYQDIPGYYDALVHRHGQSKAQAVLRQNRHNTTIYPSFTIKDAIQAIRIARPISVNQTLIETYHLRLDGAPDELLHRTITYSRLINSPASMVGPDDWDCYARMQESLASEGRDWVYLGRYLGQERPANGAGQPDEGMHQAGALVAPGTSELSQRNQFQAWSEYMSAAGE
ncbi:MAG: benzoate/toluate 1,2-dioxygenase alpha subunit [Gammaproteobacteria bacterium]|jgi:benzoate/toluate 1,2-dioxygenase alpha subunit